MTAVKIKLTTLELKSGSHESADEGMCIMEAVSYFANEPFSASPQCACPVLTSYMITLNDNMNNDERKMLKPYIKKLIGTRDGKAKERADILAWASIVEFTPYCLKLAGLNKEADAMQAVKKYDWSAARYAAYSAADSARYAAESAAESAADSAWSAKSADSADSAASAASAARYAAESAADSARYAAESAASEATARKKVFKMALKALDQALEVK